MRLSTGAGGLLVMLALCIPVSGVRGLRADGPSPSPGPGSSPETSPSPAPEPSASATDERLRRVRERREGLEREVTRLKSQATTLLGEVERLELEVRLRTEQLREIQLVLHRTNAELDAIVRRLRLLEASVAESRPVLAARSRALYKLGELSYLRMLLSVDRPSDMVRGYRLVSALARRDRERMARLRGDLASLSTTRRDLEDRTRRALALKADHDRARRGLEADRQKKSELLTALVERKETHAAFLQEVQEAEGRLGSLLAGLTQGDIAVPMTVFKGSLPWPVMGRVRVTFGRHKHPRFDTYTLHNGVKIDAPVDAPVTAVHDGTVAFAAPFLGYGLMVIVDHGGKHHSLYAHLSQTRVKQGQKVGSGDELGSVGATGVDGAGLYFEIRALGRPQDPLEWLAEPGRAADSGGGH